MAFRSQGKLNHPEYNVQQLKARTLFINVGHFLDHLFLLIFASAAALGLTRDWGLSYAELIPYATPSFIAFGVCAIPAGWLADRWSREGMMVVFFIGIGLSSVLVSLTSNPVQMAFCLTLVGVFAAIYHPVGLAMVVEGRQKTGIPLAINGVFGNMGVASAALLTGYLIDASSWRTAFALPGIFSILLGLAYLGYLRRWPLPAKAAVMTAATKTGDEISRSMLLRLFAIIFFSTAIGGLVFQSTTFALPKVFDERLATLAPSATLIGWYAFLVFSLAAFAQLVVGYLVDRHSIRSVFMIVALLQAVFFAVMTQLEGMASLLVAIAFMLVVFGQIPINDVLVGRIAKSEWRSRAYSLRYIVTFSVMASTVPFIAWVHAGWGFNTLFAVLSGAALLILVAVFFLPRSYKSLMQTTRTIDQTPVRQGGE